MNFGIGKIHPLGHSHYYKYSHAKKYNDVKRINPNHSFRPEINSDGALIYVYHQLEEPGSADSTVTGQSFGSAFAHWSELKRFNNNLPSLKSPSHLFSRDNYLSNAYIELNNATHVGELFFQVGAGMTDYDKIFKAKLPTTKSIVNFLSGSQQRKNAEIKCYAPNATDIRTSFMLATWNEPAYFNIELDAPNAEIAQNAFGSQSAYLSGSLINELTIGLDEDGNNSFVSGKPEVSKKYATWKKLKNGKDMFSHCPLKKEYGLAVLNDLPTWTDGKEKHPFGMGFHIDLRYDPEVNLALKRIDKDYITPLEQLGFSLSEEVLTDKGWALECSFDNILYGYPSGGANNKFASSTKDEILNPLFIEELELDTIILPDGYTRCNFLESDSNNQYIDTEYIPTNTTGIWVMAKQLSQISHGCSVGVRSGNNYYFPPNVRLYRYDEKTRHGWSVETEWSDVPKSASIFKSYMNYPIDGVIQRVASLTANDNISFTKEISTDLPELNNSLYLFGMNYNNALTRPWRGRIYRVKISEGGVIEHDFIPCLNPDGKPCIYDIIKGKEYINQTSGDDFLYG